MSSEIDKVGIWRALGEFKLKEALWPEGLFATLIGAGGAGAAISITTLDQRVHTTADVLFLAGAVLAVVFTALALVVSIPSPSYLRELHATSGGGMRRFLDPFLVAIGTQIAIVMMAFAYQLAASSVPRWIEHAVFVVLGFLVVFGLLDVGALGRQLVRHGILRAMGAHSEEDNGETSPTVARLRRP